MLRWIENCLLYLFCAAPWNRSSALTVHQCCEASLAALESVSASDISHEKGRAIARPFSSRNGCGGGFKVPSFPLFPSSAIFPFSPFLPPHLDITRMTRLLSQGVPIDSTGVAGAFSLGDPTFSPPCHPSPFVGSQWIANPPITIPPGTPFGTPHQHHWNRSG